VNVYQVMSWNSRDSRMESFRIEAPTAADAVTIFEYRHRRRSSVPNGQGGWEHPLSEPHDVVPYQESV
jgi:hypothetical protein